MRGDDDQQEGIYIPPEKRVPADHPLRPIKIGDEVLNEMSPKFAKLHSGVARPSIAREQLLRSLLLQIFNSVRSERMLIDQLQYNLHDHRHRSRCVRFDADPQHATDARRAITRSDPNRFRKLLWRSPEVALSSGTIEVLRTSR